MMSDQAIIALVIAVAGGMGMFTLVLFSNIKKATAELLSKMEGFVKEVSLVREEQAIKSTVLTYIQRELDEIKLQCAKCRDRELSGQCRVVLTESSKSKKV